jgi:hypothetical protein
VLSARFERWSCDATIEELLGSIIPVRSVPRIYDEKQLRLRVIESWLVRVPRVAVAEASGRFGKPKKEERLPMETVTRGLVKSVTKGISACECVFVWNSEVTSDMKVSSKSVYQSKPCIW